MIWISVIENALGNIIADIFIGSLVTVVVTKFFEILQQKRESIGSLTLVDIEIKVNTHRLKHILEKGVLEFEKNWNRGKPEELSIDEKSAQGFMANLSIISNRLLTGSFYASSASLGNLENEKLLERIVNLYEVGYLDFQIGFEMGQLNWELVDAMKNRLKREIKNSEEISEEIGKEIEKLKKINALKKSFVYLFTPFAKIVDSALKHAYAKPMTSKGIWNRGNNLLSVAVVALAGFAFSPESILEPEIPFKIDEILLFWLGVGAIGWYLWGKNKWQHSILPVLFVWAGLVIKIMAVVVEFKDKEDVGDDFGALVLFVLASLLVTFLYLKAKKIVLK